MKLSVVIITYNEERNIERCINSVKEVADDLLVLDSFSKDKTVEMAEHLGARVVQHAFDGHIQQKNRALDMAQYDHVLSLDADEALDDSLKAAILKVKENGTADAYRFNRLTNYCGHWMRHAGWYPDTKTRLLDRRKGHWGGENPHDKIMMDKGTSLEKLPGDLFHYSFYTRTQHLDQIEKFSTIKANNVLRKGKNSNVLQLYVGPVIKFVKMFFFKLGFLDGGAGWYVSKNSAYSTYLKHKKVRLASKHGQSSYEK